MAKKSRTSLLLPRRDRQDGRSIAAYYDDFNAVWNHLYGSLPDCPCGDWNCAWETSLVKQRNEDDKTRHFLIGLDLSYDTLRSNLLAKCPLPSFDEVYELIVQPGKRHLPADLLPSILSRLPVKSLLRFRCVSKPWLALVDEDADFASLHFDVFNKNRDESKLLVVDSRNECTVRCSDTFELVSKIPLYSPDGWRIVSSVDGLVLLEQSDMNRNKVFELWNPSIKQVHHIKPHPPCRFSNEQEVIGFGYDPLSKDYKVVRLVLRTSGEVDSVLVYSVASGSWRTIPFPILDWNLGSTNAVYLHGILHFVACDSHINPTRFLISFDLSNEVFSWINMPDNIRGGYLVLIDGRSSLAFHEMYCRDEAIWMLERETMTWTKHCMPSLTYTNILAYTSILYGKTNGDMLISNLHEKAFLNKMGYQYWSWTSELALYNPRKREYKILEKGLQWNYAFAFVESLKLHNDSFRERKVCEQN